MSDTPIFSIPEQRKAIEAVEALGKLRSARDMTTAAHALIETFAPDLLTVALIANLNTESSQLRGGLAILATLLPREKVLPALRKAVQSASSSEQTNATAAMILEKALGEPLPPQAVRSVPQSEGSAMASLREAVEEGKSRRIVLLEYVEQMQQHPVDVALAVMNALGALPAADRVELLRLIAQDAREVVARSALSRLEQIATKGESSAQRALYTLQFTLPTALAGVIAVMLRKLHMRGLDWNPPSPAGWRAWVSTVDVVGATWIVFLSPSTDHGETILAILASVADGLLGGFLQDDSQMNDAPVAIGPPAHEPGSVFALPEALGGALCVEAPFDVGRLLLLRAVRVHGDATEVRPLPREYLLCNDLLWQFGPPQASARVLDLLDGPVAAPMAESDAQAATQRLLVLPCMSHWQIPDAMQVADPNLMRLLRTLPKSPVEAARSLIHLFDESSMFDDLTRVWAGALRWQAVWLETAGEASAADDARALAELTTVVPPRGNPFMEAIITNGIRAIRGANRGD